MNLTKKTIYGLISLVLVVAIVIAAGIGSGWKYNVKEIGSWFNHWGQGVSDGAGKEDYSGLIVTLSSNNDIMTLSSDDNGEVVDSVTVTASVNEVTAQHLGITFSLDWERYNSAEISDYVTMTVQGKAATVTCLQGFGVPIILTATLDGTDKSASYRLDYLAPLNDSIDIFYTSPGVTPSSALNKINVDYDTETPNNLVFTAGSNIPNLFGVGTVHGEFQLNSIRVHLNYMSSDGKEHTISNTNSYCSVGVDMQNAYNGASCSVRPYITIDEFEEAENGYYSFNFNVSDFFVFTGVAWEELTENIQEKFASALLEACPNGVSRLLPSYICCSYVYGSKKWTYETRVDLTVNFGNLVSDEVEVSLNNGESGYTFGV